MTTALETLVRTGLAAGRPAAAVCPVYYATDTKVTSYSDGSTWTNAPPAVAGADITAASITAGKLSATATDKVFGRSSSGAGAGEEIALTAAGRALIDDANAAAQLVTLGVAAAITGTKIDDLTAGDDNTDLDSSTSRHGLLRKLDNDATHFLNGQGGWTAPAGGGSGGIAVARTVGTGLADYTTTSTTFADVDGTNLLITPTLAQTGDVLEIMAQIATDGGNTGNAALTFSVAGTDVGDTLGLMFLGTNEKFRGSIFYHHTMPSGTQPAIKLRWKTATGTLGMYNRTAVVIPRLVVKNLSRGGTL